MNEKRDGWNVSQVDGGVMSRRLERLPNAQLVANRLRPDYPLKWVAVQLAATATARTSPTPNPGTTVVFLIPR